MSKGGSIAIFIFEFIVLLACVFLGSSAGSIGIGCWGAVGVLVFTLGFQEAIGAIPWDVIEIIMSVCTAIGALQCSGGLDYLVGVTEKILRRYPKGITFLAPLISYLLTILTGTGNSTFSTLPVIVEVAKDTGIPPASPLSAAVVASQLSICASPISAAFVYLSGILEPRGVSYLKLLAIMIVSILFGVLAASLVSHFSGTPLAQDPVFLERLANGQCKVNHPELYLATIKSQIISLEDGSQPEPEKASPANSIVNSPPQSTEASVESIVEHRPHRKGARTSLLIFLGTIIIVVVYAILSSPSAHVIPAEKVRLPKNEAIVCFMLAGALVIMYSTKIKAIEVTGSQVFRSGLAACVCVLGVALMGDTFVKGHLDEIVDVGGNLLRQQGWTLALVLLISSCLLYSQAVTSKALYPAALAIGVSNKSLVAGFPGCCGLFILPTYPTTIACIELDDTGSTKVGRFVFNHPFILPGLTGILVSVLVAYAICAGAVN